MRFLLLAVTMASVLFPSLLVAQRHPKAEELLGVKNAQGREFWIAIPPNELVNYPVDGLEVYIASEADTDVQIFESESGTAKIRTVKKGEILTLSTATGEMNWASELRQSEVVQQKGIRLLSDEPIVVYVLNSKRYSSDGYLAIPARAWGTDYIHCSYYDFKEFSGWAGGFVVIARENNTYVEIDLRGTGAADGKTAGGRTINTGELIRVTLNMGETYMVKGDGKTRGTFDLTGSRVRSNKQVGLISFHERTTMPNLLASGNGRNHLVEMLPPVHVWGQKYVTVELQRNHLNGIGKGDVFRVVASEDDTKWSVKYYDRVTKALIGQTNGVLQNDGDFADLSQATAPKELINGVSVWEADKPILLMQYSCSSTWDGDINLDPFMIYIVPFEQYSTNSIFNSPLLTNFSVHLLNLVVWADTADANYEANLKSLEIDNDPIWSHAASDAPKLLLGRIPGTNFHTCRLNFGTTAKSHVITSNENIRCAGYLYGFGQTDAYGWPVGAQYRDLSSIDTLAPLVNSVDACGDFTATATEARNFPDVPRPKPLRTDQVETGISEIYIDPSIRDSNYRLVLQTAPANQLGEVAFKNFQFRMEVIDRSKSASARVVVRDFGFTDKNGPSNKTYQDFRYDGLAVGNWRSNVNLGKHRVGVPSQETLTVTNNASGPLQIGSVRLAQATNFRIISAPQSPLTLNPGQSVNIVVQYDALRDTLAPQTDTVLVGVGCGEIRAIVSGFAVQPAVNIADLDWGMVAPGIEQCRPFRIENPGSDTVTITAIRGFETSGFSLTSPLSPPLPIVIPPKQSVSISNVCYQGADNGAAEVVVTLSSNAAYGDSVSRWTANMAVGVDDQPARLRVEVLPQPADDMLIVRFIGETSQKIRLGLVDIRGAIVSTWVVAEGLAMFRVSISEIAPGAYTLLVTSESGTFTTQIVIAR